VDPRVDASPTIEELRLTERDRATHQELARIDPNLGGLFLTGLGLLERVSEPGHTFLVAHAGREIANGVERFLAGEKPGEALSVPKDDCEDKEDNRERIAFALGLSPDDELVTLWFRSRRVFDRLCHYGSRVAPEELASGFREFAGLLFGRIGPYFSTHTQLEALAAQDRPTQEQIHTAPSLLLRPQQRAFFYSKASLAWLQPLKEAGQFSSPPDRERRADGSWSPRAWPQGEYPVRMAPESPSEVAEILVKVHPENSNPAVWWTAVKAALEHRTV
jgi:hypothetical protein